MEASTVASTVRDSLLTVEEGIEPELVSRSNFGWLKSIGSIASCNLGLNLLSMSVEVVTLGFVGILDNTELLAACGLAITFWNIILFAISNGTLKALEALAVRVAKSESRFVFKTAKVICLLIFLLTLIPFFYSNWIIEHIFMQCAEIADPAAAMVLWALPGLFAYSQFNCQKRYLSTQRSFKEANIVFLITSSLHVFWSWLFIIKLDMEVAGAGISLSITYISDLFLLSAFSLFTRKLTLSDIIGMRHCLRYWKPYLCQAIPGMVSLLVEWGALEAMTIMAGYFTGHYEITAAVILLNVYMIANQFSMSMGLTSCNLIGSVQTDDRLVKKVGTMVFLYGLASQGLISAALIFGKGFILNFYTDDEEVLDVLN